jgi:3-dehydroquinate synthase
MKKIHVAVQGAPYDVLIGHGVLNRRTLARGFAGNASGILVSSEKVMKLHGRALERVLRETGFLNRQVVHLPDGEAAKTARAWERAVRAMAGAGLDRSSFVIAFGGGSIGDAAGFAAATYMRGIRFIQIPTTLLSMVDSSVGGKTGINLAEGKNLVGSFHQPSLVLADLRFLKTLPSRERQSGAYEILKCGILRSEALFALVERTRGLRRATLAQMEKAIGEAVRIKAEIVERDERESGERVLLNFGHTLGHALEAATAYRRFTHGEAVGYGMEFAADLGEALEVTKPEEVLRVRTAINQVGPRRPLEGRMIGPALAALAGDKKRVGGTLSEIVFEKPGRPGVLKVRVESLAGMARAWMEARIRAR